MIDKQAGHLSSILSQERAGYNMIITEISDDILRTVEVSACSLMIIQLLNSTGSDIWNDDHPFFNSTKKGKRQNQTAQSQSDDDVVKNIFAYIYQKLEIKGEIYAFSYNKTLLELPV